MKTDTPIYTLLGADPEFLYRLTDGIKVHGPYLFEALDVKGKYCGAEPLQGGVLHRKT